MTTVMIGQIGQAWTIATGLPRDTPAAVTMIGRCSPQSLFRRFHGPADAVGYTRRQMNRPADVIRLAWWSDRCVGMGVLARDGSGCPHLGVLVEDAWQRQGIGLALVEALLVEARMRGLKSVHADVMGDNAWLVTVLRRLGPATVRIESGTYLVDLATEAHDGLQRSVSAEARVT